MSKELEMRVHGPAEAPTLVYLPGIHGDWTLATGFRLALGDRVRFVEFCYPLTVDWSVADYAAAVNRSLQSAAIPRGWLVGESFGSQVAWGLWSAAMQAPREEGHFQPEGLILAGGFVRYPWLWAVHWARGCLARAPRLSLRGFLALYRWYAQLRFHRSRENLRATDEFLARRRRAGERAAILHRLDLVAQTDWRPVARTARGPVYSLTGFWDPIVPWPWVRPWLKKECRSWKGERVLPWADHTVLVTQPVQSAEIVWQWMKGGADAQSRATSSSR